MPALRAKAMSEMGDCGGMLDLSAPCRTEGRLSPRFRCALGKRFAVGHPAVGPRARGAPPAQALASLVSPLQRPVDLSNEPYAGGAVGRSRLEAPMGRRRATSRSKTAASRSLIARGSCRERT